ncbi:MAG: di-trans,poly-cis-decaprenylcistransferase [Chloroflexi bacterium]|nr:di-trans,poly-cis-decaprenylcistransferase [Chloroflexota bacterium]
MATQPQTLGRPVDQVQRVPAHVAIIMDGNGRWARKRGLPRLAGHRAGTQNIRRIIEACVESGVETLTLYAFSTENWRRPPDEVSGLFRILGEVIDRETNELHRNGVRVQHLGCLEGLPANLQARVRRAVTLTQDNTRLTLNVAFNYGGRAEIIEAVRRLLRAGIDPDALDEETFSAYLYTGGQHDPDLIIRTAGEMRLSNFLIWQAAYAEYWSTSLYWPDFGKEQFLQALQEFGSRERRFGSLSTVNGHATPTE